ncbi:MAG: hypothetical protein COV67_01935, partial [Nitrospinae bacterium CG11_big_fil_rev_8_21_14_0_20_56_8]
MNWKALSPASLQETLARWRVRAEARFEAVKGNLAARFAPFIRKTGKAPAVQEAPARTPAELKSLAENFRKELAKYPHNADLYYDLGEVLIEMHRYGEAIQTLRECLKCNPEHPKGGFQLGRACVEMGRDDEALGLLEKALEKNPDSDLVKKSLARAHTNLSIAYGRKKRQQDAMKHFQEAVRLVPSFGPAHLSMGVCHAEMGRYPEALESFRESLRLDKNLIVDANYYMGGVFAKLGDSKKAIKHYHEAISVTCKSAMPYLKLGMLYAKLKRYKEAVGPLKIALKLSPTLAKEANYKLGAIFIVLKQYEESIEYLRAASEISPDNEKVLDTLARGLFETANVKNKEEKFPEALELLKEAVRYDPKNPGYRVALGQAFDRAGEGYFAIFQF